ncbi:MAG: bestrophin family ion channel [Methylococcales bacterium]|nr:bestrophin family ion channel [Methylococcales bacterium]
MIIRGGTTVIRALRDDWFTLLFFLSLAIGAEYIADYVSEHDPLQRHTTLPTLPLGVLITPMSIFLAFQINQSYDRWWEARRLWGQLTNVSRSLSRQITTFLTAQRIANIPDKNAEASIHQDLLYRHLAYINTLRIALRSGGSLSERDWLDLRQFLSDAEIAVLKGAANVPTQLLQIQAKALAILIGKDVAEQQVLMQLDNGLSQLYDIQGSCERIKRSAFPDRFNFHTRLFVWVLAVLIPFCLIETEQRFDVVAMTTETLLAFIFVTIERLGSELRDPFENRINDTPMSTLCRSIEIDLRQQLGETQLPPPLAPVGGVLM